MWCYCPLSWRISGGRGANDEKILDNPSVWLPESCAGWAKTGFCIVSSPTGIMMDDARSCFIWIYKKLKGYSINYSRRSEGERSDSQQMRTQRLCHFSKKRKINVNETIQLYHKPCLFFFFFPLASQLSRCLCFHAWSWCNLFWQVTVTPDSGNPSWIIHFGGGGWEFL